MTTVEWQGRVLDIGPDSFTAVATEGDREYEARIPMRMVRLDQRHLVTPGALFSWIVHETGTDSRSVITFSDDRWTADEIDEAFRRAEAIHRPIAPA